MHLHAPARGIVAEYSPDVAQPNWRIRPSTLQVFLMTHRVDVAVGTPGRVRTLIEDGALDLSLCRYMILDCQRDAKEQTMCAMYCVERPRAATVGCLKREVYALVG